jgi:calcium-dependent protein kinase
MLGSMDHPNIIRLHEVYEDSESYQIVMDRVGTGSLHDTLKDQGPFPEKMAARVMRKLLVAVDYLHQNKIMHRDLKPENILMTN